MYGDYRIISGKHLGKMGLAESKECLLTDKKKFSKSRKVKNSIRGFCSIPMKK